MAAARRSVQLTTTSLEDVSRVLSWVGDEICVAPDMVDW